jgi:hypothetical protein
MSARARSRYPIEDRAHAWLVTGPLGRAAAFLADLAVALGRGLRRRD